MNLFTLIGTTVGLTLFCFSASNAAEARKTRATSGAVASAAAPEQLKTAATRKILVERMKASRERLKNTLPAYEEELEKQSADY